MRISIDPSTNLLCAPMADNVLYKPLHQNQRQSNLTFLKNNCRSYYRCTNPRCNAKKQLERSTEDPDILIVTYEGLHLHNTYSHFLLSRPSDSPAKTINQSKKTKTKSDSPEPQTPESPMQSPLATTYDTFERITNN
jgi:WRKY DNA -binding domain